MSEWVAHSKDKYYLINFCSVCTQKKMYSAYNTFTVAMFCMFYY